MPFWFKLGVSVTMPRYSLHVGFGALRSALRPTAAAVLAALSFNAALGQWNSEPILDRMTGVSTPQAVLRSKNALQLNFPYQGATFGTLHVQPDRRDPKFIRLLLLLDRGQVDCSGSCRVRVRFDDWDPIDMVGTPAQGGHHDVLFIQNEGTYDLKHGDRARRRLLQQLTNAKRIHIGVPVYQHGEQLLEFESPAKLVWPPK